MVLRILTAGAAVLLLLAAPASAQKQQGVGSRAPRLVDVDWLSGKPLKQFRRGTIYLVYFWATSALDCSRTVPLLGELRDKHAGQRVELIGINIWPRPDTMPAETFLEKREGFMDFPLARDRLDRTAREWDKLVGLPGVPRVVVIDRRGAVAWSGHPFDGVDLALQAVLAGDEKALAELVAARTELHEKADELVETIRRSWKYKWWNKAPDQVDELIALDERLFGTWASWKYEALIYGGKQQEAAAYGRRIVDEQWVTCEVTLNELAWFIVDPHGRIEDDQRDVELALRAARFANELSGGRDAGVLDTLARAHFLSGDADGAVGFQQQAVQEAFSSEERKALEKTLAEYQVGGRQASPP